MKSFRCGAETPSKGSVSPLLTDPTFLAVIFRSEGRGASEGTCTGDNFCWEKGKLTYAACLARPHPLYRPPVGAPPPGAPSVVAPPPPLLSKLPVLYTLPRVAVLRSFAFALPSLSFSLPSADAPCLLPSSWESVRTRLAFRSPALPRTTSVPVSVSVVCDGASRGVAARCPVGSSSLLSLPPRIAGAPRSLLSAVCPVRACPPAAWPPASPSAPSSLSGGASS